ncbi:hypothetical protein [Acinetobacter modestus]|uniref:hypothetical protein n=1 Tax=Acinetobacter modestus TaxID=1776740 RepID=UPI0030185C17
MNIKKIGLLIYSLCLSFTTHADRYGIYEENTGSTSFWGNVIVFIIFVVVIIIIAKWDDMK